VPRLVAGVLCEKRTDEDIQGLLAGLEDHVSAKVRQAVEQ
jgi:hypothetical protein